VVADSIRSHFSVLRVVQQPESFWLYELGCHWTNLAFSFVIAMMDRKEGGTFMSDDKTKRGTQDRARINVNEDYERRDWAKKLGVSQDKLRSLVKKHGPSVSAIKKALGK
jgi:hypothetical protein